MWRGAPGGRPARTRDSIPLLATGSVLRRLAVDVRPLRSTPAFRRLWTGNVLSFVGTQMTTVAAAVQVFQLTGSSLAVGVLSLAALAPLVGLGLFAGAVADAVDRRRLALFTSSGIAVCSALLWLQADLGLGEVWPIYLLVAIQSGLTSFDTPTRRLFVPRLVPAHELSAANALFQLELNLGLVCGPLAAGGLIALAGLEWAYLIDAIATLTAVYAIARLPAMRPEGGGAPVGLRSIGEGLTFLRRNEVLHTSFLVDIAAMVFAMPRALFPELAIHHFGQGAGFAGVLYASPAIGALAGGLVSGWIGRVRRQGATILWSVVAWGIVIAVFGLVGDPALAVVALAVAGIADMISAVLRSTILQVEVPDGIRGRLTSIYMVVVSGGPRLGDAQSGGAAALLGPTAAVVAGAAVCVASVGALAGLRPRFRRYLAPAAVAGPAVPQTASAAAAGPGGQNGAP